MSSNQFARRGAAIAALLFCGLDGAILVPDVSAKTLHDSDEAGVRARTSHGFGWVEPFADYRFNRQLAESRRFYVDALARGETQPAAPAERSRSGVSQTLCYVIAALAVALLWIAYRINLRRMAKRIRDRLRTRQLERERIADELHDTLLQGVQGLIILFHAATDLVPEGTPARKLMDRALDQADKVLITSRDQLVDLRAHLRAQVGLGKALIATTEEFALLGKAKFNTSIDCDEENILEPIAECCYLIAREALFNAVRHSGAEFIDVSISCDTGGLVLCVSDDGQGIQENILLHGRPGHRGLASMRERAISMGGTIMIQSTPPNGTSVRVQIPAKAAFAQSAGLPDLLRRLLRPFRSMD